MVTFQHQHSPAWQMLLERSVGQVSVHRFVLLARIAKDGVARFSKTPEVEASRIFCGELNDLSFRRAANRAPPG